MFRYLRGPLFAIALGVLPLGLSGCLWLAVPSLAYQGYKYEKQKSGKQEASTPDKKRSATKQTTPPQNLIE